MLLFLLSRCRQFDDLFVPAAYVRYTKPIGQTLNSQWETGLQAKPEWIIGYRIRRRMKTSGFPQLDAVGNRVRPAGEAENTCLGADQA